MPVGEEIYQPPLSNIERNEAVTGSPVKAIAMATVVDLVGTFLAEIALTIAYNEIPALEDLGRETITIQLLNLEKLSLFALSFVVTGCAITVYAAYLCARSVNYSEYKFVSIFSTISVLIVLLLGGYDSFGDFLVFSSLTVVSALTGAWLHARKKEET